MEDRIIESLKEWLKSWRENNGISIDEVLSGEVLEKFISELQTEITNVVSDFSANEISESAKLVLYSGTDFELVKEYCETSNDECYMIRHTAADVLWDPVFRQEIASTIGEMGPSDPITAQVLEGKIYNEDGSSSRISNLKRTS